MQGDITLTFENTTEQNEISYFLSTMLEGRHKGVQYERTDFGSHGTRYVIQCSGEIGYQIGVAMTYYSHSCYASHVVGFDVTPLGNADEQLQKR